MGSPARTRIVHERSGRWSWHVLGHRDFQWYFIGNVCSNLGTWLQNVAQIILAYRLTGSDAAIGLVICAQFACPLVLAPWAGVLADRMDRKQLLIITHGASAFIAALLAWLQLSNDLTILALVAGALGIGMAYTFTLPALSALVPMLVPEKEARAAMAMNTVSFNIGRALAPLLGVGVIAIVGFAWAFALNAISFVVLTAVFYRLHPRDPGRPADRPRLMDGLRIALQERRILVVLVMVATITVTTDPPLVLGPALARDVFHVPDHWSGYFLAAQGTGTVLGALLPSKGPSLRRVGTYVGFLGGATVCFAVFSNVWLGIMAVVAAGAAALMATAATQTLLFALAGPPRMGRVMAVWAVAFAGSRPITALLDGWLASTVGARTAAVVIALPALVLGIGAALLHMSSRFAARARGLLAEDTGRQVRPVRELVK
jgi:MFS family permease